VKITAVEANNHKRAFDVRSRRARWSFPFAKCEPEPTSADPIVGLFIDPELAREGFTYRLASGAEGCVLMDWVLDYNEEPGYMRQLLLHNLTVEALERLERSRLSKREIIRRLGTSPAQLYRLLDPTNYRKSVDKMLALLQVLDCEVEVIVRQKSA
jgi:hypothetical protein